MEYVLGLIGVLFMAFSFIMNCKNLVSSLVFKVFPFFSGVYVLFYAIMELGVIQINL